MRKEITIFLYIFILVQLFSCLVPLGEQLNVAPTHPAPTPPPPPPPPPPQEVISFLIFHCF